MATMEESYRRDHEARDRMRELREQVLAVVNDPPVRMSKDTRDVLAAAGAALWQDMLRIDAVWD